MRRYLERGKIDTEVARATSLPLMMVEPNDKGANSVTDTYHTCICPYESSILSGSDDVALSD